MAKVLHEIRTRTGRTKNVDMTRKTAIFLFCQECVGWEQGEVDRCTDKLCPLYPFRSPKAIRGISGRKMNKALLKVVKARQKRKK